MSKRYMAVMDVDQGKGRAFFRELRALHDFYAAKIHPERLYDPRAARPAAPHVPSNVQSQLGYRDAMTQPLATPLLLKLQRTLLWTGVGVDVRLRARFVTRLNLLFTGAKPLAHYGTRPEKALLRDWLSDTPTVALVWKI